jgi:hypothetical protein
MLLKSLDKSELQAAFLAEESQRRRRPEGPGGGVHCHPGATCYFCEQAGHCTNKCHAFKQAKSNAKANASRSAQGRHPRNANKALRHLQHLLHPLHLLHHPQVLLAHPQHPRTLNRRPTVSRASENLLAMQVFVPLTPPILFALYNLMQTQVPLLI